MDNLDLNEVWDIYYRDPASRDWSLNSYKKFGEIRDLEGLKQVIGSIPDDKIKGGYICIMRNGIKPVYEDPENENGGAWTFKMSGDELVKNWKDYLIYILTDNLIKNTKGDNCVNGLVLCPKRNFSIMQIWTKGCSFEFNDFHNPNKIQESHVLFRSHNK